MIKLYDYAQSGNCYKVRLLLSQLGIPFEKIACDQDPKQLAKSPFGVTPFVELPDGRFLGESHSILHYFAEDTRFMPDDRFQRALVLQWMFFEQYNHETTIATSRHWLKFLKVGPEKAEALKNNQIRGHQALARMEAHLKSHSFFVGTRYSIADIALYAYTHLAPEAGFDLTPYIAVQGWLKRVSDQPGYVSMV